MPRLGLARRHILLDIDIHGFSNWAAECSVVLHMLLLGRWINCNLEAEATVL